METDETSLLEAVLMLVYVAAVTGAFGYFLVAMRALSLTLLNREIDLEFFF